jgi:Predicted membrane protein
MRIGILNKDQSGNWMYRVRVRFGRRLVQLLLGLFLYGVAISAMVQAAVGLSPWDVLAQGISLRTGIPFGWVTNLVGAAVLLLWIPIRQRPGLGTILNVLLIGPSAQLGLGLIPHPTVLWEQVLLFTGGLLLLAAATGLYLGARLGPGPRDGLMTGLHSKTGRPIWAVRTVIELTVLAIGWLLGGNVGFGTLAFALLIGPLCNLALPLFAIRLPVPPAGRAPAAGRVAPERSEDAYRDRARPRDPAEGILIEPDSATRARWDRAPR